MRLFGLFGMKAGASEGTKYLHQKIKLRIVPTSEAALFSRCKKALRKTTEKYMNETELKKRHVF